MNKNRIRTLEQRARIRPQRTHSPSPYTDAEHNRSMDTFYKALIEQVHNMPASDPTTADDIAWLEQQSQEWGSHANNPYVAVLRRLQTP